MHSRDFVHLDIKHDNILLTDRIVPKLADFGFARRVAGKIKNAGYTRQYAPLEVLRGTDPYDGKKADIYSLGVVFFSTLTKDYPPTPL